MAIPYSVDQEALFFPGKSDDFFDLIPAGEQYDAWLCAELSRLVYVRFGRVEAEMARARQALSKARLTDCDFFDHDGTECFLAKGNGVTVLAFRGTESGDFKELIDDPKSWFTDYATDADVKLIKWPQRGMGRVHAGFAKALGRVREFVEPALEAADGRVMFTGHSLGAALATLAAKLWKPDALYTFGSPRVGDRVFAEGLSGVEVHRVINCCDIVCQLPLEGTYTHVGDVDYIDRRGVLNKNPSAAEMLKDQVQAQLDYARKYTFKTILPRNLADHAPINYVSAFAGRAKK